MNTVLTPILHWQEQSPALAELLLLGVRASALYALASLAACLLGRRSARSRSWLWRVTLLSMAVSAAWAVRPEGVDAVELSITVPTDIPLAAPQSSEVEPLASMEMYELAQPSWLEQHCFEVWSYGILFCLGLSLVRYLLGCWWLKRKSAALRLTFDLPAGVNCRSAKRIASPLITGIGKPTIWLPEEAAQWPETHLRAAIAHELAHWHRKDVAWQALGTLVACIWWWLPTSWLALRHMQHEAELAADDLSVSPTESRSEYATALIQIASGSSSSLWSQPGVAMAKHSQIETRVRHVLSSSRWRNRLGYLSTGVLVMAVVLFSGIALVSCKKQPPKYVSIAKLVAGGRMVASNGVAEYHEYLQDFYGTIIETIESNALDRRTKERVRALNPDLKECEVEIKVTQNKGSSIFNVTAIGDEPISTRTYLNALLDEFKNFRNEIIDLNRNKAIFNMVAERAEKEQVWKEKQAKLIAFTEMHDIHLLRAEYELLTKEYLSLPPDARDEIRMKCIELSSKIGEYDELKKNLDHAQQQYRTIFDKVDELNRSTDITTDFVQIMERASPPELVKTWW